MLVLSYLEISTEVHTVPLEIDRCDLKRCWLVGGWLVVGDR